MYLYILRHGIAAARGTGNYPNDDRPLTPEGIETMRAEAAAMAKMKIRFDAILTSPLQRAYETARIVADVLHCQDKIEIRDALAPGGSMQDLFAALNQHKDKENVLVVGHEPDLSWVASMLLGAKGAAIEFKKGSLCSIWISDIPPLDPGTLIWHLTAKQLKLMAE
jgi:phosphohistidine phosphatase